MNLFPLKIRPGHLLSRIANCRSNGILPRKIRRFRRDEDGATAVEFAMIATPFFALMYGIVQVSVLFLAQEMLDTGVNDAARMIRTGQAQIEGKSKSEIQALICARVAALIDCDNGLVLDVRSFPDFKDGENVPDPLGADGEINNGVSYSPGSGGEVVIVRAFYAYELPIPDAISFMSNMTGGRRLLAASAAFRNEPF